MKQSTIWFLAASGINTATAYAMLEDIWFNAQNERGALLGLPGVIVSMILSRNPHEWSPEWMFIPVNFVCDFLLLLAGRKFMTRIHRRA